MGSNDLAGSPMPPEGGGDMLDQVTSFEDLMSI